MSTPTSDEQALTEQIEEAVRPVLLRRALMSDVDLPAYIAHAALPIVKVRDARVRAEAVAPVLALHQPREEQVISGDCAAEECEHEDECPTIAFAVCAECYRVAEESDPYFGERGLSSVAHPCPSVRAVSIEQETQP